ncbi:unnamed protein product [Rotaria sp. Silwood1]|nr:unnamed protein product [Rotaria sp. Silwood1]CAF0962532.1 unnamed protein product [Rotaria sp. Silwood1]CAF3372258.1 unnamed protein product [Rotaria sp. Silwood1]CAF4595370.1 unnamed protein product [Rotaria sp. Silwood1]
MDKSEYIYVNEHLISSSLVCPICLSILEDPHTHIICDSAFCRSCLLQLVESNCPICRCYWSNTLPIEFNIDLPKSSRLIRNMLDELLVECVQCHTIHRRGDFKHECQPIKKSLSIKTQKWKLFQIILSTLIIILSILIIYYNRNYVFETAIDRRNELIHEIGTDIDKYLFNKIYYLIVKMIEYSMPVFIFNICLWLVILFFGDRFTSKTISQILKKILEISIIINLIGHSLYY